MSLLLTLYKTLTTAGTPVLKKVLASRVEDEKEDPDRIGERMGQAGLARPKGPLVWIHGASVGESQSTLILIDAIAKQYPYASVLVTTGTVTSAQLMAKRLPPQAIHQFVPVDHPQWVGNFLDHWKPDMAMWMESELWPNMVMEVGKRHIPLSLINARLSERSFLRWKTAKGMIAAMLNQFSVIITQTKNDEKNFRALGAKNVETTGNLKYSSTTLPCDEEKLQALKDATQKRPIWVYASTHDGEETLACRIHEKLKIHVPDILTIIVPRHIHRRDVVASICKDAGLSYRLRGEQHDLPQSSDDIYIADTLGELGLFYSLAPIAMIGRSFSSDGGGGHNPVEAAQLGCVVLTGPNVQYQQQMFDDMFHDGAAIKAQDEDALYTILSNLFGDENRLHDLQEKSASFAREKSHVIDNVMAHLSPYLSVLGQKDAG